MSYLLTNKKINLTLEEPGENYSGSRFDWTGKIISLDYCGTEILSSELPMQSDAQHKKFGRGLYNEFGTNNPLGFSECAIGGHFHKIGIGAIEKSKESYNNQLHHSVSPAEIKVIQKTNSIEFCIESRIINGYGYHLNKHIKLQENGVTISYFLKNTGVKKLESNEYNHNFLCFGPSIIGPDYTLTLPTEIRLDELTELVNKEKVMSIKNDEIRFLKTPTEAFFISTELKNRYVNAFWKLENKALNIGISETGNFKTRQFHLWGLEHVISPELFIDIEINPSETKEWTRTYSFYELT